MLKKLAIASVATLTLAGSASAADLLGCRKVGFLTDRDVISVGASKGYSAIKLTVRDNGIDMLDLDVVYGNGNPDDPQVRSTIAAGGETRWIDLKGGKRAIRQIKLAYKSKLNFKGFATVCAYGR